MLRCGGLPPELRRDPPAPRRRAGDACSGRCPRAQSNHSSRSRSRNTTTTNNNNDNDIRSKNNDSSTVIIIGDGPLRHRGRAARVALLAS